MVSSISAMAQHISQPAPAQTVTGTTSTTTPTQKSNPNEMGERLRFLRECNIRRDAMVGAACECMMKSIGGVMSIGEFNRINELSKTGNVPPDELRRFSELLSYAKQDLVNCTTPPASHRGSNIDK